MAGMTKPMFMSPTEIYRVGCVAGAREALAAMIPHACPHQAHEVIDWIVQLEAWVSGPLPDGPTKWNQDLPSSD